MLLAFYRQEEAELLKTRTLLEAMGWTANVKRVYDIYKNVAFPYMENAKQKESINIKKLMNKYMKLGPMSVSKTEEKRTVRRPLPPQRYSWTRKGEVNAKSN